MIDQHSLLDEGFHQISQVASHDLVGFAVPDSDFTGYRIVYRSQPYRDFTQLGWVQPQGDLGGAVTREEPRTPDELIGDPMGLLQHLGARASLLDRLISRQL